MIFSPVLNPPLPFLPVFIPAPFQGFKAVSLNSLGFRLPSVGSTPGYFSSPLRGSLDRASGSWRLDLPRLHVIQDLAR
jgi:hypothetical protein